MSFDKEKTNMVKAFAIIMMLMHHLFGCATQFCATYGTTTVFFDWGVFQSFCLLGAKACVGIFVFLSSYGITKGLNSEYKKVGTLEKSEIEKICFKRYIKLALNFLLIYVIAVLTSFLRKGGIAAVYGQNGWKHGILYAILDALGISFYFLTPSLNETWWYMSIAILIIFIVPILVVLYKKFGKVLIAIGALIFLSGISQTSFTIYLLCVLVGISCAEDNVLEKVYNKNWFVRQSVNNILKFIFWFIILVACFVMRMKTEYSYWIDPLIAISCCEICMNLYALIPVSEKILNFLGKHSMNIFLIHTLIFEYYFTSFIYYFNNWIVVLILCLTTSLIFSVIIEFIKKCLFCAFRRCQKFLLIKNIKHSVK